ncbi:MAG TPA: Fic family protein [Candidatus Kapabacteria bacterium]|nr:Fic family protein [Candidatus Kapabacteria bacterium]
MQKFETDILKQLPLLYPGRDALIDAIAVVHAELLFIHPFREGNGRVMRILANAMAVQQGFELLHFEKITEERFDEYVAAVQAAADENYEPMKRIIRSLF